VEFAVFARTRNGGRPADSREGACKASFFEDWRRILQKNAEFSKKSVTNWPLAHHISSCGVPWQACIAGKADKQEKELAFSTDLY
jgi:hypothetical protein